MSFKKFYFKENEEGYNKYSSLCFNFPEEIAKQIIDFGAKSIPDNILYIDKDNPDVQGRKESIYCNILKGIHEEHVDDVRYLTKDIKPFDIEIDQISFYGGEKFDVVKLDLNSFGSFFLDDMTDYLCTLNKYFRTHVEYTCKWPEYKAFATIAHIKKNTKDDLEKKLDKVLFQGVKFQVRELVFKSFNGTPTVLPILY